VLKARWAEETRVVLKELGEGPWISAELGVLDLQRFREAVGNGAALHWWSAVDVSLTLFVEVWLRANRPRIRGAWRSADTIVAVARHSEGMIRDSK
jgi:hypothetical protein